MVRKESIHGKIKARVLLTQQTIGIIFSYHHKKKSCHMIVDDEVSSKTKYLPMSSKLPEN